jgi:hypothetical protein
MQIDMLATNEGFNQDPIRELDEDMLLEALKETSIGTAGAVQVFAPDTGSDV